MIIEDMSSEIMDYIANEIWDGNSLPIRIYENLYDSSLEGYKSAIFILFDIDGKLRLFNMKEYTMRFLEVDKKNFIFDVDKYGENIINEYFNHDNEYFNPLDKFVIYSVTNDYVLCEYIYSDSIHTPREIKIYRGSRYDEIRSSYNVIYNLNLIE